MAVILLLIVAGPAPGQEPDGRQIYVAQCALCHGVAAAGIAAQAQSPRLLGPDLTAIAGRFEGSLEAYLRRQPVGGRVHKREFRGSDEELAALIDWLAEQEGEPPPPPVSPPRSEETAVDPAASSFTGAVRLGVREVDVGGSLAKFREDVNLEDGARLFELDLDWIAAAGADRLADRVWLDVDHFGGDPYQTLNLGIAKHGLYDLTYRRRESSYFYNDFLSAASGPDLHSFDFARSHDSARLSLPFSARSKLRVGFDRYGRDGDSVVTRFIQGDVFVLNGAVDDTLNRYTAAYSYSWDKVTLTLEERFDDYSNAVSNLLPGAAMGALGSGLVLNAFTVSQPYDFTSFAHTVRLEARPDPRLDLSLAAAFETLDLDLAATRSAQGVDPMGSPFSTVLSGSGDHNKDLALADADLSYRLNDRVSLLGGAWYRDLDQAATFRFGGVLRDAWQVETSGVEAGVEVLVNRELVVAGGVAFETRDFRRDRRPGRLVTTERTGFFTQLGWRPGKRLRVTAAYEDNSRDDPVSIGTASDAKRFRAKAGYRHENGLSISGSYLFYRWENDLSGWDADHDQADLRLGFERSGLSVSLGYALVEGERSVDQTVNFVGAGIALIPIFFETDSDFIDGRIAYRPSDRFAFGVDGRTYETAGSFPFDRYDLRGYADVTIGPYLVRLAYRSLEYDEDQLDDDDYDADIIELSLGFDW